jgi:hypothetical protein
MAPASASATLRAAKTVLAVRIRFDIGKRLLLLTGLFSRFLAANASRRRVARGVPCLSLGRLFIRY